MNIARRQPSLIFGAAASQTRSLRGSSDIESGSMSPKIIISAPVRSSRMKNAELSTVAYIELSFPFVLRESCCAWVDGEYDLSVTSLSS